MIDDRSELGREEYPSAFDFRDEDIEDDRDRFAVAIPRSRGNEFDDDDQKVVFRSPRYRHPTFKEYGSKDRSVRHSNWGRADRFREDKKWVPGPGKYNTHDTEFSPRTVRPTFDNSGITGHTWSEHESHKKSKQQRIARMNQSGSRPAPRHRSYSPNRDGRGRAGSVDQSNKVRQNMII